MTESAASVSSSRRKLPCIGTRYAGRSQPMQSSGGMPEIDGILATKRLLEKVRAETGESDLGAHESQEPSQDDPSHLPSWSLAESCPHSGKGAAGGGPSMKFQVRSWMGSVIVTSPLSSASES